MSSFVETFKHTTPYAANPLRTRSDVAAFLTAFLDPLASHTSPGGSRIHLGHTGTHFDETAAQLEGFARPLWGLASLIAGGGTYAGVERWARGLASGTDPNGEEYWGEMRDRDQRMVECSPIGFALAVAGREMWDPLSEEAKENVGRWLNVMNTKEMPNTNWLWFRVFANLGLAKNGSKYGDLSRAKKDMDHLDTFYVGDGWSRDGPEGVVQLDYYSSSFAIQFAQLVYSKLAQNEDPERCEAFRQRARQFALDFVHYFDEEGRAVAFGRSLVYRFAMSSFWGALAFADVELPAPLTWGVVKGIQLRNLRYWAAQPGAYNPDGTLTLGYAYPNLNLTENYNSPGSPYWCCKSFVSLALPESHPFWSSAEEPFPSALRETVKPLYKPLHIATNLGGHTYVLSSGQRCSYPVKQSAAKYGKFAYSTAFAYSVPVGDGTLEEHAGDSALLLSDDDGETWRARRKTEEFRFENDGGWLRSMWYPWSDVEVETWLIPPTPAAPLWHVRVHRVRAGRKVWTAEGAWAIYGQRPDGRHLDPVDKSVEGGFGFWQEGPEARAHSRAGASAIVELGNRKQREGKVIRTDANSSLMWARAVLPTLLDTVEPTEGDVWYVTAVFGKPNIGNEKGASKGWMTEWEKRPDVPKSIEMLIPQ
ncbi:hypothetical protein PUNSTDRAFT_126290 [Punctularia strigosozonata HHB-11173 SS5]|uniref:uncharacterized protein n=1 Tax=Punctularia strigosozonata (strain HHB-11173) TaxID=741275 RepID=UPI0004416CD8|nr:uncharacterized protein PUNSTDRAFT_126290 [Punctularia strigosozonata HHB-11173 SS5]EIN09320.1 hypothetical protein PUNSTDRAFT_126290 [Punctularia strigosozonata HHB-11173 SS5]